MGPTTNPELFHSGVEPNVLEPNLLDEVERRAMLAPTLADLSAAFGDGDPAVHRTTEPTLPFKLVALAMVQRTELGVAGTNPMDALRVDRSTVQVRAQTAPPHDSYQSAERAVVVRTRAIMIDVQGEQNYSDTSSPNVEFFGLNMYVDGALDEIPDELRDAAAGDDAESSIPSGLVIIGKNDRPKSADSYIAGETPVIAVRNKETGDAKVYSVTSAAEDEISALDFDTQRQLNAGHPVIVGDRAYVLLPTGQVQCVTVLKDAARRQAADEFASAAERLKGTGTQLSAAELEAVRAARSHGS